MDDGSPSPLVVQPPRFTLLEALEDAIDSIEQLHTGEWEPDGDSFQSALDLYRETVAWEKQRMTLFRLTDEDVQTFARKEGLTPPLTLKELNDVKQGIDAGLGAASIECLDAAIDVVIHDRAARPLAFVGSNTVRTSMGRVIVIHNLVLGSSCLSRTCPDPTHTGSTSSSQNGGTTLSAAASCRQTTLSSRISPLAVHLPTKTGTVAAGFWLPLPTCSTRWIRFCVCLRPMLLTSTSATTKWPTRTIPSRKHCTKSRLTSDSFSAAHAAQTELESDAPSTGNIP